jgi:hypothetical protein
MGLYVRAWQQFRFLPERDVKLRVVQGGRQGDLEF